MQAVPWRPLPADLVPRAPFPRMLSGRRALGRLLGGVALVLVAVTGPLEGYAEMLSLAGGAGLAAGVAAASVASAAGREARARAQELRAAAHDLRGPLGTVSSYVELVACGAFGPVSEEACTALRRASAMTRRAQEVVEATLRAEPAAAMPLGAVDLDRVTREAVEALAAMARERGGEVVIDGVLPPARGERTALFRVVANLVQNGLKYAGDAGGPRVRVHAYRAAGFVVLEVRDNGAGFSEADRGRVFTPGARGAASTLAEGHGLGLAIVQRLVTAMGGMVEIPRSDTGAVVRVTLPAA